MPITKTTTLSKMKYLRTRTYLIVMCLSFLSFTVAVAYFSTIHMSIATFAYFLLVVGLYYRKQTHKHALLMTAGIVLDLSLVLALQIERNAIHKALNVAYTTPQYLHIIFSTIATLLYVPVLTLGALRYSKKLRGSKSRNWHLKLGMSAFVFRTLGFLLMFFLLNRQTH